MRMHKLIGVMACAAMVFGGASVAGAHDGASDGHQSGATSGRNPRSLVNRLEGIIGPNGILIDSVGHVGHFTGSSISTLGSLVGQLAASAADFPAISTTPGFTYSYDPKLKAFERSSKSLGSVFVDRADTVGKGRFDFGMSYLYVDFKTLNGDDLKGLTFSLTHQDTTGEEDPNLPPGQGNPLYENDTIDVTFTEFSIRSHVFSLFGTYGVTDDWDVNILVPVVVTSLEATADAQVNVTTTIPGTDNTFHPLPGGGTTARLGRVDDEHTGVGDILLRTKYRLGETAGFKLATGLSLRVPSGSENNLQGTGDVTLTPAFVVSRALGPHEVHANFGLQADFQDNRRSRARYAVGASMQLLDQLAFLVDLLGSSNLVDEHISTSVPVLNEDTGRVIGSRTVTETVRTDIVDLAMGLKFNVWGSAVVFVSAIVPLNSDGLRADVIPVGGAEISF